MKLFGRPTEVRPDRRTQRSPPGDSNPQPLDYKSSALPVELGGRAVSVARARVATVDRGPPRWRPRPRSGYSPDSAVIACSSEPWPFEEKPASGTGGIGSGTVLRRRSSSPRTTPNSRWRHAAWASALRLPASAGSFLRARVEAVAGRGQRPGSERLGQRDERSAGGRRQRHERGDVGVDGAEHGAVAEVPRERRPGTSLAARDRLAEQLDVVVARSRTAQLVERLLERPQRPPRSRRRRLPGACGCGRLRWPRKATVTAAAPPGTPMCDGSRGASRRAREQGVNTVVYWSSGRCSSRSSTSTSG